LFPHSKSILFHQSIYPHQSFVIDHTQLINIPHQINSLQQQHVIDTTLRSQNQSSQNTLNDNISGTTLGSPFAYPLISSFPFVSLFPFSSPFAYPLISLNLILAFPLFKFP